MFGCCRKRYLTLWFWVDAVSCIPLECVFYTIAPHVYWYNIPKFIRSACKTLGQDLFGLFVHTVWHLQMC